MSFLSSWKNFDGECRKFVFFFCFFVFLNFLDFSITVDFGYYRLILLLVHLTILLQKFC
jgi:hypothetical protein